MNRNLIIVLIILVFVAVVVFTSTTLLVPQEREGLPANGLSDNVDNDDQVQNENNLEDMPDIETVLEDLAIPWGLEFLPDGTMIITERTGTLLHFNPETGQREVISIPTVIEHVGEGGLLGVTLHPDFEENLYVYLYMTTSQGGSLINRVERYTWSEGRGLRGREIIISGIPGAVYHDGGRMDFGPDGNLYITTGDAGIPELSQNMESLAGKILRIRDDGSVPADNPFNNEVYSYGHRNPQGLTWDERGQLWSTEHGPTARDELNLIESGGNYGWPDSVGDVVEPGTVAPVVHSGLDDTWAPASALYWDGSIFFAGLRGRALYEAVLDGNEVVELIEHFKGEFGRLRTVALGHDGAFYLTTSNRDGRGTPGQGDDKVIRINPLQFRW